ncbi:hypothetical protein IAQ61_009482 [Plenodomus lingam]|uniref:uncharacterized protein n=1 Tax=Leptosphaeria maculans TaxID=5022 RepID=UPI00332CC55E|nr:hypothetical protein IAQ61_009482 [Plenodomus lingam]
MVMGLGGRCGRVGLRGEVVGLESGCGGGRLVVGTGVGVVGSEYGGVESISIVSDVVGLSVETSSWTVDII